MTIDMDWVRAQMQAAPGDYTEMEHELFAALISAQADRELALEEARLSREATERAVDRERDLQRLLGAAKNVLAIREQELLDLKGPCSNKACRLHYAHSGPCDERALDGTAPEVTS